MNPRQIVQIPAEQVQKIIEIKEIRKDLIGFPISKAVHLLLQERIAEIFKEHNQLPAEKITQGKWFEYIREPVPVHIWAPISLGVVRNSQEMIGYPFTQIMVYGNPKSGVWGTLKEDIYGIGNFLLSKLKNVEFAEEHYQKHLLYYQKLLELGEEIHKQPLQLLSKTELYALYSNFYKQYKKFNALSFDIDAMDIVLEQRMKEKISVLCSKAKINSKEQLAIYNLLSTPIEPSYVNQEKEEVYQLALEISKDPKLKELFRYDTPIIAEKIKNDKKIITAFNILVSQFWWTGLGWNSGKNKTVNSFIGEVKEILRQPHLSEEVKQIDELSSTNKLKQQKEKISKELTFDQEMKYFLEVFEKYALFHDHRKEIQMKSTVSMNRMVQEVATRQKIKYEDLLWSWPAEIQKLILTNKIDLTIIEKRKEAFFYLISEDNIEQLTGEIAIRRKKEELGSERENIANFQGLTASIGKVTGIAKVCYSPEEAVQNISAGNILVTSMTTPEFVPSMKKAAAIVTNEGGITCHAAIVSRELKIPCIVGTGIATKTIYSGDLIEVNANHGVVNILKRKLD